MRLIDADRLSDVINNIDYVPVCIDCYTKHELLNCTASITTGFFLYFIIYLFPRPVAGCPNPVLLLLHTFHVPTSARDSSC